MMTAVFSTKSSDTRVCLLPWLAACLIGALAGCSAKAVSIPSEEADAVVDVAVPQLDATDTDAPDASDDADVGKPHPGGCYACHGTQDNGNPAPPLGTNGETDTTDLVVGAHQQHLTTSDWHRDVQCEDCHKVPNSIKHKNGVVDYAWSSVATAMDSSPTFDAGTATCSGAYCHGGTLFDVGKAKTKPVWTQVDGTFNSCGAACHLTPPSSPHPSNTQCGDCHDKVIASFDPAKQQAVWKDATLHINGQIDVKQLTCTACHGNPLTNDPAPPKGTHGETKTAQAAVGAHQQHLGTSNWHRVVTCTDCHAVPTNPLHADGKIDFSWSGVATAMDSVPAFDANSVSCSGAYCHGGTLYDAATAKTTPVWNQVNGTFNACGAACHLTPPGGPHPQSSKCADCHDAVLSSFDPATQSAIWKNPALHVNGQVDVKPLTCTSCHGDAKSNNPAPPLGTKGETKTTDLAVGAHAQHLATSDWHRNVDCTDCHAVPTSTQHANGTIDFLWSTVSTAMGSKPTFDAATASCNGAYCHGGTLSDVGKAKTKPVWTEVTGSYNACGAACHLTPPSAPHPKNTNCAQCHDAVIADFDQATQTATWKDASLHINGQVDVKAMTCTTCHGDAATNNPAPPKGTNGETATTQLAVGAHAQHLNTSAWHRQVDCTDCHAVPTSTSHANGTIDFVWSAVATAMASTPSFSAATATCSGAYCHGGTLYDAGKVKTKPVWTQVDSSFNACGASCHMTPPSAPHPQNSKCAQCHDAVIATFDPATKQATWKDAALHVNGKVDVVAMTCTTCHGDAATNNPAPPKGTNGETQTTDLAVGAHAKHLAGGDWHRPVVCTDCHATQTSTQHANGVIDFAWGAVATAMNAAPKFNAASATCSGAYCHGGTLYDATTAKTTPVWTQVDGSFSSCGAGCHMTPPGAPHPQNSNCADCHDAVIAGFDVATQKATWKNAALHINGTIDVKKMTCTTCHGDAASNNPAPPKGTKGETKTTELAVGAHAQHLAASGWHRQVDCADCHVVPTEMVHASGVIDFSWSAVATAMDSTPTFDATSATCSGAYCHGGTLYDAATAKTKPVWTQVDGTFNSCGAACHMTPPAAPHPTNTNCADCHDTVIAGFDVATQKATWKDASLHIDGKIDVKAMTCTSCHGDAATNNSAPPKSTSGATLTTDIGVGAHAQHLAGSAWHRQVDCTDCHVVPTLTTHADGKVALTWSAVATAQNSAPTFDANSASCSGAYCHGGTLKDTTTAKSTPVWTQVDGSFKSCGASCHLTPPAGEHTTNTNCALCHDAVIASFDPVTQKATWKDAALHIDGKVDVKTLTCTACHGDPATKNPAPPTGTHGESLTNQKAVGAHAKHLATSTWHRPVACTDCHAVPTDMGHSNGNVDLTWSAIATALNSTPQFDATSASCSGAYCHGGTLPHATTANSTPVWTQVDGTFSSCGASCHLTPPAAPHTQNTNCALCHDAVIASFDPATQTATWKDASLHVNGKTEVKTLTCTACHGDPVANNPAPPQGTHGETLTSQPAVGAHAQHLANSAWHRQVDCADCHAVPTAMDHSNGVMELTWGAVATAMSAVPQFDVGALTCSGAYCHGSTLADGFVAKTTPVWTQVDGTFNSCGAACHMTPPGAPHPQNTQCAVCHDAVIASFDPVTQKATWTNAALHINGQVDVKNLTCTTCHGTAATNNPAPPLGTKGETLTTQLAVGAHAQHLAPSTWHRDVVCTDCHAVPNAPVHANGVIDFAWSAVATAMSAVPSFDANSATCSGAYCHGETLIGSAGAKTKPVWTKVDGTFNSCGAACHTTPPAAPHPQNTNCIDCHDQVLASFDPATQVTTWANAALHIDGKVEVKNLTCTSCHGDAATNNPAPPFGTKGETLTTQPAVGAHAQHLASSTWHRQVACTDCHVVPAQPLHANGAIDLAWSAVAAAMNAVPQFDAAAMTCSGAYCHGATLQGTATAKVTPVWTQVDGTFNSCGAACHRTPPGGTHPQSTKCADCHDATLTSFDPVTQTAVWKDPTLHIDGKIDVKVLTCTTCHGDAATNNPAPPKGTHGETLTTQPAVGAHAQHLAPSTWHRQVDCKDCHAVPDITTHANGTVDFLWSAVSTAMGSVPQFDAGAATCSGAYCHGGKLLDAATAKTNPVWTQVDGSFKACGAACHMTPPGGTHPAVTNCALCHAGVVASVNPGTGAVAWANAALHVDGVVEKNNYHTLADWTSPKFAANGVANPNHHGYGYFLVNHGKDDKGTNCTDCHGADYNGGSVGISCNNSTVNCHGANPAGGTEGDWKACNFCHGTATQNNPPTGVANESTSLSLAVGRHAQHITASTTHIPLDCTRCHIIPFFGDLAHTQQYAPSADLSTTGHHGDVTFAAPPAGVNNTGSMIWNVAAAVGAPVAQRGTCMGACHSNGRGGAPLVTPYWAGGNWNAGSCASCHAATPTTGHHDTHLGGNDFVLACTSCHPDAASASHVNGLRDVLGTIVGLPYVGGVTSTRPTTGGCTTSVRCNGTCHGEVHTNYCW